MLIYFSNKVIQDRFINYMYIHVFANLAIYFKEINQQKLSWKVLSTYSSLFFPTTYELCIVQCALFQTLSEFWNAWETILNINSLLLKNVETYLHSRCFEPRFYNEVFDNRLIASETIILLSFEVTRYKYIFFELLDLWRPFFFYWNVFFKKDFIPLFMDRCCYCIFSPS